MRRLSSAAVGHFLVHHPALDVSHLATALAVRNLFPDIQVLSFDDRVRANAAALGFEVAPISST